MINMKEKDIDSKNRIIYISTEDAKSCTTKITIKRLSLKKR